MLTPAQLLILKAAILAETDPTAAAWRDNGTTGMLAEWYNAPHPSFIVWRTRTLTSALSEAIAWANFTPADAPDGSALWQTRALACQGKQFNVQNLLLASQGYVASGLANVRAGWQDATSNIPAGPGGALITGGWANIRLAFQRYATRVEALFATGAGTQATPGALVFEGTITDYDVVQALTQV